LAALLPPELRNPERVQELLQTAGNTGKAEDALIFQRKNKQCFNGYTIILRYPWRNAPALCGGGAGHVDPDGHA
jgi:hypothetical protein